MARQKNVPTRKDISVAAAGTTVIKQKKKRRFHPGTVALREIRRYQKSCDLLLRRAPFMRLVREIAQQYDDFRFKRAALEALQEGSEEYLVEMFRAANLMCVANDRKKITRTDLRLAVRLRTPGYFADDSTNLGKKKDKADQTAAKTTITTVVTTTPA